MRRRWMVLIVAAGGAVLGSAAVAQTGVTEYKINGTMCEDLPRTQRRFRGVRLRPSL